MSVREALDKHQAGDRVTAERLYRIVLVRHPDEWQALHGLGVLCFETGRQEEAIGLLERAAALKPDDFATLCNLGAAYASLKRFAEAERQFRAAAALDPKSITAQYNLANVLKDQGRSEEALAAFQATLALEPRHANAARHEAALLQALERPADATEAAYDRAIALDPDNPRLHFQRGRVRHKRGLLPGAIEDFTRALALKPDYLPAVVNLGAVLQEEGRHAEAEAMHRRALAQDPTALEPLRNLAGLLQKLGKRGEALELRQREARLLPDDAECHNTLGNLLNEMDRYEEACRAFERALQLRPESAAAFANLAYSLGGLEQFELARQTAERAIQCDPTHGNGYNALGHILHAHGRNDEAIEAWQRGVAAVPEDAGIHANLALGLLKRGDYEAGWREYGWRTRTETLASLGPEMHAPRWEGQPLEGRTLLILREQGMGDIIQFARYAEIAAERGARVLVDCPPSLRRLFASLSGADRIVEAKEPGEKVDFEVRLMDMPQYCGTRADTIPARIPYLAAEPEARRRWQVRLTALPRPWIGLVWQGNPRYRDDRNRSLPLAALAPLLDHSASFVSLQKGQGSEQILAGGFGNRIVDWTEDLGDFADTAALVDNLDLVVTIDSAVGHLAGALGRPAWIMLSHITDFRWFLDRADSPWYPHHRLFRQPKRRDWASVVAAIGAELRSSFPAEAISRERAS